MNFSENPGDTQSKIKSRAEEISRLARSRPEFQDLDAWGRHALTKAALDQAEAFLCAEIEIPDGWKKFLPFLRLKIFTKLYRKVVHAFVKNQNEAAKQLLVALRNLQASQESRTSGPDRNQDFLP